MKRILHKNKKKDFFKSTMDVLSNRSFKLHSIEMEMKSLYLYEINCF
jgi:hypothetical protein